MVPSASCTRTHIPNPLAGPDSMTVPSATDTIGVPMAFAMSTPLWEVPQRAPNPEVNWPWAGSTNFGARAAAAASATLPAFASDAACEGAPARPVVGGTARTPVVAASSAGAAGLTVAAVPAEVRARSARVSPVGASTSVTSAWPAVAIAPAATAVAARRPVRAPGPRRRPAGSWPAGGPLRRPVPDGAGCDGPERGAGCDGAGCDGAGCDGAGRGGA